ncbi:MAG: MerR family transcriptional regulator [Actinomycetota bacterium]
MPDMDAEGIPATGALNSHTQDEGAVGVEDADQVSFAEGMGGSEPEAGMTIDELARRAAVTTRNVRAYQTKGLLPPPSMVGRVGYYGEGHLARLRYIAHLQQRGFSLAAIHDLIRAWEQGRSLSDVLGFEEALTAPWVDEVPEVFSGGQLVEMFPEGVEDPGLLLRAVEMGLLIPEGEDFKVPSPRLLHVGAELVAAGIPLAAVLDAHAELVRDTQRMARRFVQMFERHIWEPYVAAGLPAERLEEITNTLRRLRPTAWVSVHATLMQAMERAVGASTSEQLDRLAGDVPEQADAS